MKKTLFMVAGTALLLTAGFAFAQEDDSLDSFGSFDTTSDSTTTTPITFNGNAVLNTRAYVDQNDVNSFDDLADFPMSAIPTFTFGTEYTGATVSVDAKLKFSEATIKTYQSDIIDELTLRANMGNFLLEAGKMKLVWGKGDKLHVVDNFNADDYTDFIIPDYIDHRISTPMLHAAYSFSKGNLKLEAAYAPVMATDRFATTGVWVPASYTALSEKVTAVEKARLARALSAYTTATAKAGATAGAASVASESLTSATAAVAQAQTAYNDALSSYTIAKSSYETAESEYGTAQAAYSSALATYTAAKSSGNASATATAGAALQTAGTTLTEKTTARVAANEILIGATAALAATKATLAQAQATETAYQAATAKASTAYAEATTELTAAATAYGTTLAEVSSFSADNLYPETNSLRYGQAGARLTGTVGSFDWGASYYYGHYKQPSVDWSAYITSAAANSGTSYELPILAYDQKQVFGLEGATVLGPFNLRAEGAYTLTDDTDGTDAWVHNNSVSWVGGFDIDLPISNINVNIQETGTYILNNDQINGSTYEQYDVDYDPTGHYTNDKLVCNISDSYLHDKLNAQATVMWGIERGDVIVMPKLAYTVDSSLELSASGMYIWCADDNSEFAAWKNNSFVNLGVSCKF